MSQEFLTELKINETPPGLEEYRVGAEAQNEPEITFVLGAIVQTFMPGFNDIYSLDNPFEGVIDLTQWDLNHYSFRISALGDVLSTYRISSLLLELKQTVPAKWGNEAEKNLYKGLNVGTHQTSVEMVRNALLPTFDAMRRGVFEEDLFVIKDEDGRQSRDNKELEFLRISVEQLYFTSPDEVRLGYLTSVVGYLLKKYYSLMDAEELRRTQVKLGDA